MHARSCTPALTLFEQVADRIAGSPTGQRTAYAVTAPKVLRGNGLDAFVEFTRSRDGMLAKAYGSVVIFLVMEIVDDLPQGGVEARRDGDGVIAGVAVCRLNSRPVRMRSRPRQSHSLATERASTRQRPPQIKA